MSSAENHRKRSHRSHARQTSAMRGERRNIIRQASRSAGAAGTPLIFRMQAMFRRAREVRQKREEAE